MNPSSPMKTPAQLELLTIEEVATELKIPQKTIRQWIYLGRIPNIKLNGHVRFLRSQIDGWIRQSVR